MISDQLRELAALNYRLICGKDDPGLLDRIKDQAECRHARSDAVRMIIADRDKPTDANDGPKT